MQNLGSRQLRNATKRASTAGAGPLHVTLGPTQVKAGARETTPHPTHPLLHRAWRRPAQGADCPGQGRLKNGFWKEEIHPQEYQYKNLTNVVRPRAMQG